MHGVIRRKDGSVICEPFAYNKERFGDIINRHGGRASLLPEIAPKKPLDCGWLRVIPARDITSPSPGKHAFVPSWGGWQLADDSNSFFRQQLWLPLGEEEVLANLLQELADIRWQKETGGITIDGMEILTDRESQSQLANAYSSLREGFLFNTRWKSVNGWQTVDTETMEPIARAVALHTAACFAAEEAAEVVLRGMTLEEMKEVDVRVLFMEKLGSLEE